MIAQQERINEKMIEYVPELDSKYALTPRHDDEWRSPRDVLGNGNPCFVMYFGTESELEETPIKQDYIWIPDDVHEELLAGYYHLSTREAYREVFRRITLIDNERKNSNLSNALKLKFRSKDQKEEDKLSKKVLQLIKSRLKQSESSHARSQKTDSKAERRRSSLRNSAATLESEISLMGF
mmetsp:Transcript_8403/g.17434  ORF Transcript_8403/g.17434 Transcript_8403/m.17434 type:complete len:181 (-) Transcript_8403:74-616(-)